MILIFIIILPSKSFQIHPYSILFTIKDITSKCSNTNGSSLSDKRKFDTFYNQDLFSLSQVFNEILKYS